jgi:outer membrane protein
MAIATALMLIGQAAHAQSLSTLFQSATGYDATYAAAKAQAQASRARADQARAGVLPVAGLSAGISRSSQEVIPDIGTKSDRSFGARSMSLSLSQALYRPSNWATYEQGKRQLELADAVLAGAEQEVMMRLSQAYFDVLAAKDTLVFIGAQKAAITEQLASAKRNFEVGTSTITDTREAQARYDLMLAQEVSAQNDLRIKTLALESVSGVAGAQPKPLMPVSALPEVAIGTLDEWVVKAVAVHPTVKQATLAVAVAKLEVDKASAAHKPTVDLTASYGKSQNAGGSGSSAIGSRATSGSIGVNFNMPLFAGFAHENRIKETMALLDKATTDLTNAERSIAQAVRSAYLGTQSLAGQIKALQAAEQSSQSALDANRLGYQVGVRINIDVLNSQTQLFQTKRDLAKARYDYLVAGLRLRQAAGQLEVSDLDRVNGLLAQ